MLAQQVKFLELMTARALLLKADEHLQRAARWEARYPRDAHWEFRRACWVEYEAIELHQRRRTYREYWEGLWEFDGWLRFT